MPIRGLTDKEASFPQIGTLRKGAVKPETGNKPGADLKHFRFDTEDKDAAKVFADIYGGEPRAIRVFVPYAATDQNFEAWQEEWSASSLRHRCDGQTCVLHLSGSAYSNQPKPCPGNCKPAGRLKVIVPELRRMAFVTVMTTSKHDIMEIHANLSALEAARGDLRGIPLLLKRVPREISTPDGKGGRARREKWLIAIEAQPQWVELQLSAQERAALPTSPQLALNPGADADDDDDAISAPSTKQSVVNGVALISEADAERIGNLWDALNKANGTEFDIKATLLANKGWSDLYSIPAYEGPATIALLEKKLAEATGKKAQAESGVSNLLAAIKRVEAAGITPDQWQSELKAMHNTDSVNDLAAGDLENFTSLLNAWALKKEEKAKAQKSKLA